MEPWESSRQNLRAVRGFSGITSKAGDARNATFAHSEHGSGQSAAPAHARCPLPWPRLHLAQVLAVRASCRGLRAVDYCGVCFWSRRRSSRSSARRSAGAVQPANTTASLAKSEPFRSANEPQSLSSDSVTNSRSTLAASIRGAPAPKIAVSDAIDGVKLAGAFIDRLRPVDDWPSSPAWWCRSASTAGTATA